MLSNFLFRSWHRKSSNAAIVALSLSFEFLFSRAAIGLRNLVVCLAILSIEILATIFGIFAFQCEVRGIFADGSQLTTPPRWLTSLVRLVRRNPLRFSALLRLL